MSTLKDFLQTVANAIKVTKGVDPSTKLSPNDFSTEINNMAYVDGTIKGKINKVSSAIPIITNNNGKITATTTQETGYVNDGGKSATLQLNTKDAATITPTTNNQTISKDQYLIGDQIIKGDPNLTSDNILRGKDNNMISIFGVNGNVDKIHRLNSEKVYSDNYAAQVVDCAKSYYIARKLGLANFQYSQSRGLFNNYLTDSNGYCCIDCSTFGSSVVRGIDFFSSPYNGATGTVNKANDPKQVRSLCDNSQYVWSDKYLDRQIDPAFNDIGYSSEGYYSVRNAAQLAEYYYFKGNVLYEYDTDPTNVPSGLTGGELLFWSKPLNPDSTASIRQHSRFKAITHVGIVDRNGISFFQVTGSESKKGDTVLYSQLEDHLQYLRLIIKPNYSPISIENTRVGMELIPKYHFDSCYLDTVTKYGTTFNILQNGGFSISANIPTASITFYIFDQSNCITLDPGVYKLSGCPVHEAIDINGTSTLWGLSFKTENGETLNTLGNIITDDNKNEAPRVWDRGQGGIEFTIKETTKVYVYFYLSSNITSMNSTYTVKPSLIRIS